MKRQSKTQKTTIMDNSGGKSMQSVSVLSSGQSVHTPSEQLENRAVT